MASNVCGAAASGQRDAVGANPAKAVCPRCNGTGEVDGMPCVQCSGTGETAVMKLRREEA